MDFSSFFSFCVFPEDQNNQCWNIIHRISYYKIQPMGIQREYSNNNFSLYFEAISSTCKLGMHHSVITRNPFTCSKEKEMNVLSVVWWMLLLIREVTFNFMSVSEWFRWHNCKWCSFKWSYTANIITSNWWFWRQWYNSWSGRS